MFDGEGEITCEGCGRVWFLTKHRLITRDPDSFECKHAKTLHSWDGACFYTGELTKGLAEDKDDVPARG
jgi:hypothetical protein